MCRVKEGIDVVCEADLQNLVTSVILRQTKEFSLFDVTQMTRKRLQGSRFLSQCEPSQIEQKCKKTMAELFLVNRLRETKEQGLYELTFSYPHIRCQTSSYNQKPYAYLTI